jgi:hypothetical protein
MERNLFQYTLGKKLTLIPSQIIGIGETWRELTTFLGTRINTFQCIVVHVGPKEPHLH